MLLEAGLRLGGFVLLSIQEYGNSQSIKQKGTYRILCLGESTTQNQYPLYLEEILNQRNIGVRFSIIDKGRIGTYTSTILSQIDSYLAEYHPDMVVAMMGINDGGDHIPFEEATASKGMLFTRSFKTYKLVRLLWLHILTKAKEIGFYKSNEDRRSSGKVQTFLPEIGLKETPAESILTEDSSKKAIELNPRNDQAYIELGAFYLGQGKFPQAEDLFKKAIELNPKNDFAHSALGAFYREQGKFPQAEDLFKKAIELNPKNDFAYIELRAFYREQGKFPQVEDLLKKVIELNPRNDHAYVELGELYRDQGKFRQAEDLFKKAVELNPKNERFLRLVSSLYEETGKPELAKEYAKKINRLRLGYYFPVTINYYRKLKEILDKRGIKLVCVQYPMRHVKPLKEIFEKDEGVIFVDNEGIFKEALKKVSRKEYFRDMFAGDFGHCTEKGNQLLAENIANVILREVFHRQ
ncbi:MAG: tetratricopeptide repeat protein [Candidatus Omnitrophota bacterium]